MTIGSFHQGQLKVELRYSFRDIKFSDIESRQRQVILPQVLECQGNLEQRVVRLRAHRIEYLDQPLERHVCVSESREITLTRRRQQIEETHPRIDVGTQHERVDEHADQIVELRFTATGDRGADCDVGGAGQPGKKCCQRRVHHHEQRCLVLATHSGQSAVNIRGNREAVGGSPAGEHGWTRAVTGQGDLVRNSVESFGPVADLLCEYGFRVTLGTENLALPQRVVGILHRQRRPGRGLTL